MGSVDFPTDFPYILTHKRVDNIKNHPSFIYAKNGDLDHAYTLVKDLINKDKIEQLKKYSDAIIVPVHAMENEQVNKIPIVYAKVIGKLAGLEVDTNIYQTNKIGRTNMSALERLLTRAKFEGEVKQGRNYIIVDDVATQGGTLSELRSYIEKNGGHVVLASTLAYTQFSTILAIRQNNIEELERRFGRNETEKFLKDYGIADRIEQLTNSEARHILSYKSLDRIREMADEIRNRKYSQGIGQYDDERSILREVSNLYEARLNMLQKVQKEIDKERFAEVFSNIFNVKKQEVLDFINKDENGIKNIFYHPTSFSNDNNFLNKITEFKELNSILKNLEYDYQISDSTTACKYMQNLLGQYKDKERLACVFLNSQNYVIAHQIFEGTVDQAPVYKREILKLALNYDAKNVLIGHNHPGGGIYPSIADKDITASLQSALKVAEIRLLDHIIVGQGKEFSFAENAMIKEETVKYNAQEKYKFQNQYYDINEIKEIYKEYGKKLEINFNKEDYEKFNELKEIVDSYRKQNIEVFKKDITEKSMNLEMER